MRRGTDRRRRTLAHAAATGLIAAAGCAVGPDFHPPHADTPSAWSAPAAPTASQVDMARWWTTFGDPELSRLVEAAVQSNLDLRQAEARLRQARAARGVAFAGLWPTLDATGGATRSGIGEGSSVGSRKGGSVESLFLAGLDAAWEIDVFGGAGRRVEAADADVLAAAEDRGAVLVSLVAEVALDYVDLRSFQQRIVIARANLDIQEKSAAITRKRQRGGLVSGLDVDNADALTATTQADIPVLETAAWQEIYALSVLLGREPTALVDELSVPAAIPVAPPEAPLGVPSDLLRQRPDIRSAEARVHAATAQIGAATADLFPKFTLTGTAGTQSDLAHNVTRWESRFWSFGPSADWQIFNAGAVQSNIEVQRALAEQSLLTYRQTVLTALQDVENALVASSKEQEHHKFLQDAVTANRKAVALSTRLYSEGQTDFVNVLVAQRALSLAQDALVQSDRNISADLVALYKALGGGWDASWRPPETDAQDHAGR
jgi:NodT family efflux transporter outer membrane factor (OMF) lipoprotein